MSSVESVMVARGDNWVPIRLKRLAQFVVDKVDRVPEGARYVGLEHVESWTGRLLGHANSGGIEGGASVFTSGDILFGRLRPYLAKVHLAEWDGVCSPEIIVLRARPIVLREFLAFVLLAPSFVQRANSLTYGTKMPRVSAEHLSQLDIAVPPIDVQRAVVEGLRHAFVLANEAVADLDRASELIRELRSSLVEDAVCRQPGRRV